MEIKKTACEGLIELYPRIFGDDRGFFLETFREEYLQSFSEYRPFIQDNLSFSQQGVLRGLHLQLGRHAQAKYVTVMKGKVLDVAVDVRPDSPTYGKVHTFMLSEEHRNAVYIPRGFAHGFLTLTDALFYYKCDNYYNKESEAGIKWNDPDLNINWQLGTHHINAPLVSEKDNRLPTFQAFTDQYL